VRRKFLGFTLLLIVVTISFVTSNTSASLWRLNENDDRLVESSLFNLNIVNLEIGAGWPTFTFHSWRIFHSVWSKVEPRENKWEFSTLDSDIALAEKNGVEPLLVLATTPTWASSRPEEKGCCLPLGSSAEPKSLVLWENYVRKVGQRYKGRVNFYELWNEPNIHKNYTGSIETLVKMSELAYKVLKEIDPGVTVVSPSMAPGDRGVPYLHKYLKKGGNKYADVIGFHFYAGPYEPERPLRMIQSVRTAMRENGVGDLELWNTESGWKIINEQPWRHGYQSSYVLTTDQAAAYVIRSHLLFWSAGVTRFYWYAWGHMTMGLSDVDAKTPKLASEAYKISQEWVLGATLKGCDETKNKVWMCRLQWESGKRAWVIWTTEAKTEFTIPGEWSVKSIKTLDRTERCLSDKAENAVEISDMPKLLLSVSAECSLQ
jgi:hypothetical protein